MNVTSTTMFTMGTLQETPSEYWLLIATPANACLKHKY